ncbi:MAG: phosphatase PAP2 family protein [Chitinispirillaceae bacterium]|nr:phosphatase PAP2 family protein [Chitinispirillaceae bacterium]
MLEFLTRLDAHMFFLVNSHHSPFFDCFFSIITWLGSGWVAVPLVGAVIILFTRRSYLARALVCAAMAGLLAGITNTQMKWLVHRPRPAEYFERLADLQEVKQAAGSKVHMVGSPLRRNSFPSGHAATAFAAASILYLLYGGNYCLVFILALFVAYSRVYMGAHFPLDVAAGAALGSGMALCVILFFRGRNYLPPRPALRRKHAEQ